MLDFVIFALFLYYNIFLIQYFEEALPPLPPQRKHPHLETYPHIKHAPLNTVSLISYCAMCLSAIFYHGMEIDNCLYGNQQSSFVSLQQSCWNCGRKASETCSGCNTARYCGSFCQHKDWEKHHHVCGQGLPGNSNVPLVTPSTTSISSSSSVPPTHSESTPPGSLSLVGQTSSSGSPKEVSSSSVSRSTTPATPALMDSSSR